MLHTANGLRFCRWEGIQRSSSAVPAFPAICKKMGKKPRLDRWEYCCDVVVPPTELLKLLVAASVERLRTNLDRIKRRAETASQKQATGASAAAPRRHGESGKSSSARARNATVRLSIRFYSVEGSEKGTGQQQKGPAIPFVRGVTSTHLFPRRL